MAIAQKSANGAPSFRTVVQIFSIHFHCTWTIVISLLLCPLDLFGLAMNRQPRWMFYSAQILFTARLCGVWTDHPLHPLHSFIAIESTGDGTGAEK